MLCMDNGPESISLPLDEWTEKHVVKVGSILPGKLTQNDFIERLAEHTVQKHSIFICSER